MSKRIINRDIIPYFKRNDYYGGLNRATDAIFEVLSGEYKNTGGNNASLSCKTFYFNKIIEQLRWPLYISKFSNETTFHALLIIVFSIITLPP